MSDIKKDISSFPGEEIKEEYNEIQPEEGKNISDGKTRAFSTDIPAEEAEPQTEEVTAFSLDDMEALLKSVGLKDEKPKPVTDEKEPDVKKYISAEKESKPEDEPEPENEADQGHTRILKKLKREKEVPQEAVTSHTRHYNIGKLFSQKEKAANKTDADGQLILDGYSEDLPENVSEEEIEAKLRSKRKHFVDNFRVLTKLTQDKPILERISQSEQVRTLADSVESEEGKTLFDAVDKADKVSSAKIAKQAEKREKAKANAEKSKELKKALKESVKKRTLKLEILFGISFLSLVLSVITAAYNPGGLLEYLLGNGARVYTGVNIALLVAGVAVSFEIFKKAAEDVKDYKITGAVSISLVCIFVLIHNIISFVVGMNEETGFLCYTAFALFAMAAEMYSQVLSERTLFRNLSVITKSKGLVGLQKVDNKADADVLAKQITQNDYPVIYYSADAALPEEPRKIAGSGKLDSRLYSFSILAVMAVSLVFGLVSSIVQKRPSLIATAFTGAMCLLVPVLTRLVGELLHANQVASISTYGGVITGIDACEELEQANAFVFDAQDIFEAKVSKFRVVPKSLIALSDTVIFAASTLKNTKSLLADSFDDFVKESKISLPEAENVQYEDGLGYSSWVVGRRVLVGNREMLVAHSVECPTEEEEARYAKGKSVMYVAVEGMVVASFIVSYSVRSEVRKSVSTFKDTGIIIMFCGSDPCLSEAVAASKLGVDAASVKLVTSPGSEIISAYKEHEDDRVDNGLLCSKKQKNVLALACAAHSLCTAKHIARVITIIGMAVNFVFLAFCAFMGISSSFTSITVIILQALWCAVSYYVGKSRLR